MINFTLRPYEWQKEMEIFFPNSNLKNFTFSASAGMDFRFINSFDGRPFGTLKCEGIWRIQHEIDATLNFPVFIGDVRIRDLNEDEVEDAFRYLNYGFAIPKASKYYLVCINGGEISTIIICGKINITQ